jgi:hypothetical protein
MCAIHYFSISIIWEVGANPDTVNQTLMVKIDIAKMAGVKAPNSLMEALT